jgi:hypothetical protein
MNWTWVRVNVSAVVDETGAGPSTIATSTADRAASVAAPAAGCSAMAGGDSVDAALDTPAVVALLQADATTARATIRPVVRMVF